MDFLHLAGQDLNVVALVAGFWKGHLVAEELLVSQKDRAPQSLNLSPGIIYVVLALHPMASGFQYAGKSVT